MKKYKLATLILFAIIVTVVVLILLVALGEKKGSSVLDLANSKGTIANSLSVRELYLSDELKDRPIPTNRVWSSLLFTGHLNGAFFIPYSVSSDSEGIRIGIPSIITSNGLVKGPLGGEHLTVKAENTSLKNAKIVEYSDITVTARYYGNDDKAVLDITFVQGSPYIYIKPYTEIRVFADTYSLKLVDEDILALKNENSISFFSNTKFKLLENSVLYEEKKNGYITLGAINSEENFQQVKKYSGNIVNSVFVTTSVEKDSVNLTYNYSFEKGDGDTLFGMLPHHQRVEVSKPLYTISTIRGKQSIVPVNNSISVKFEREKILEELPNIKLVKVHRNLLKSTLDSDLKDTQYLNTSYFGGKRLARSARLIQISDIVNNQEVSDKLRQSLTAELVNWFTYSTIESSKYFEYDKGLNSLIAHQYEFGSEKLNDHHFHYGYFIYAASVIGKSDKEFVTNYGDLVNAIASDYGSWERENNSFPYVRAYDWYENHSWASGFQSEIDGNNQESTSEAINAWYSLWLWSQVSDNEELEKLSEFLYSSEIASTKTYWLNQNDNLREIELFPQGYNFHKASLVWGGKYEYNTFFSTNPLAIEGIQYLPITPGSIYLNEKKYIDRDYNVTGKYLGDKSGPMIEINYMYYAMSKGLSDLTTQDILTLPLDDGNSRSNLLLWMLYWDDVVNK